MQVVVLLLLVAGLALLVLGLITGSTPLVVASIAASLVAVYAIVQARRRQQAGASGAASRAEPEKARVGAAPAVTAPAAVPAAPAPAAAAPAVTAPAAVPAAAAPAAAAPATTAAAPAVTATPVTAAEPPEVVDSEDPAEAHTDPPLRSRGFEPVWVIDGRPRYHLPSCGFLLDRRPEPVPLRQAVEDGFSPCALCDPDSGLAAGWS